ncbi:TetR/AcrR family transcriptional regulator [Anaeromicropila herbilytica]|uniref:TetR family transcriptional regulator n=1 Tax=Anaeromicropila herbilytica TaxID=2785025 RepID=A0A7R7ICV7_9FIRM|nr:TetR/AcrR family transcriptional regulator [Anaeromicropila herbilytica]BCN31158.1 TetR family transcriptional regulator [Anaeromicropila herbilytica]
MKMQKLTSRKLQAEATKNKLYQVAIELLEKEGFEKLKVEDVCKAAGVSIGSFYNYFSSKYDILSEIFIRADQYFEEEVKDSIKEGSTLDKILEYFDYYAKYNQNVGIDIMKQLYTSNNKIFTQKGRYMQELLKQIISDGQETGEISTTSSPEEICEFLFIAARGVAYDWCIHDGEYNIEEYMHQYMMKLIVIFKKN